MRITIIDKPMPINTLPKTKPAKLKFQLSTFGRSVSVCVYLWTILLLSLAVSAQDVQVKIRQSLENRDYQTVIGELETLKKGDKKIFELNNYDYLLARLAEKKGDFAAAAANYQAVVNRNSILKEYALWHLAQVARTSGNLLLESTFLQEILTIIIIRSK